MTYQLARGPRAAVGLLLFELNAQRCALRAEVVRRIVRAVAVARLPKAPAIVEGVLNVAGTVVPLLDIRQRFGLAPAPLHPDQHLVIAAAGRGQVALRVDRATELIEVPSEALEPADVVPGVEYVAGIAKLPDGLLVIHDLDRFLALDEAAQLDAALAERAP